jgi:hypothetical protein
VKTDDLIAMLSTNVEPVNPWRVGRTIAVAVAAGAVVAVGAVLISLGVRADLMEARAFIFLLLKLLFTATIVVLASIYLARLARPGGERRSRMALTALPFLGIIALAAISLVQAPHSHWDHMIVGDQWLECILSVPIIAIVPFAVVIWAMRQACPTHLVRTGALCGLVAGGLSAAGYALHCADDSLPFVALWYGGTVALCTLAGATLGPRLLRW